MKTLAIHDILIQPKKIAATLSFINGDAVEHEQTVSVSFNREVTIFKQTVIDFFTSIYNSHRNKHIRNEYELKIGLEDEHHDELMKQRQSYSNCMLLDGTGLDSHAIKLISGDKMKICTISINVPMDKLYQVKFIDDQNDINRITVLRYDIPSNINDFKLNVDKTNNFLILGQLLIDHFKVKTVINGNIGRGITGRWHDRISNTYCINEFPIINDSLGTSVINLIYDKDNYVARLVDCQGVVAHKLLRKYICTKAAEKSCGIRAFNNDEEEQKFVDDRIKATGFLKYASETDNSIIIYTLYLCLHVAGLEPFKKFMKEDDVWELKLAYEHLQQKCNYTAEQMKLFNYKTISAVFDDVEMQKEVERRLRQIDQICADANQTKNCLVYALNNKDITYINKCANSINSYLQFNHRPIDICILTCTDFKYADELKKLVKHELTFIDAEQKIAANTAAYNKRSSATYYRFCIFCKDLYSQYDNVLYLDSDTEVFDCIEELYDCNSAFNMVQNIDWQFKILVQYARIRTSLSDKVADLPTSPDARYYNAGVLLFKPKYVSDDVVAKILEYCISFQTVRLAYCDQDILNVILNSTKYIHLLSKLPCIYNSYGCTNPRNAIQPIKIRHWVCAQLYELKHLPQSK